MSEATEREEFDENALLKAINSADPKCTMGFVSMMFSLARELHRRGLSLEAIINIATGESK